MPEYFKDFTALQLCLGEGGVRAQTHKILQQSFLSQGPCLQEGNAQNLLFGERMEASL